MLAKGEEHFKDQFISLKEKFLAKASNLRNVPVIGCVYKFVQLLLFLIGLVLVAIKWVALMIRGSDRSMFKTKMSGEQKLWWSKPFDIADVKLVGKVFHNATVNDIVLNSIAGAMMRYTERRSLKEKYRNVTLSIPVNIRTSDTELEDLSNKFGFMLVPLQLGIRNPELRLRATKKVMDSCKCRPEPFCTYNMARLCNILPPFMVSFIFNFLSRYVTAIFTNVLGSDTCLSTNSIPIREILVFTPMPPSVGLGIATCSYNGNLTLTLCSDTLAISSPNEFMTDFENDLNQIISMAKSCTLTQ